MLNAEWCGRVFSSESLDECFALDKSHILIMCHGNKLLLFGGHLSWKEERAAGRKG